MIHLSQTLRLQLKSDERGSVTAEVALLTPAVLGLIALMLGLLAFQAQRVELIANSTAAARALARGEDRQSVENWLAEASKFAKSDFTLDAEQSCVELQIASNLLGGELWAITERSCARNLGW